MFNLIQSELKEILLNLEKDCSLKSGHLSKYIPDYSLSQIEQELRPALVVFAAKLFKNNTSTTNSNTTNNNANSNNNIIGYNRRCMVMAEVIQLIYIAQDIHNRITDDCSNAAPQFPVLVGDYLFSKFFKKLSDNDMLEYLAPLALVICKMNEGGIIRRERIEQGKAGEEDYLNVLFMEYGLLMGMACKLGGTLAGGSEEEAAHLEQFGINLGMAWGACKEEYPLASRGFLNIAQDNLLKIPPSKERDDLWQIGQGIILCHDKNGDIGNNNHLNYNLNNNHNNNHNNYNNNYCDSNQNYDKNYDKNRDQNRGNNKYRDEYDNYDEVNMVIHALN